jgi:Spy/CpxP family protein refolding chaperone
VRKFLQGVAVALVGMTLAAGSVEAQGGGQGRGGPGRMMERLFEGITLTEAQTAQRDSIVKVFQPQMPAFTPGTQMTPEDRQKRMEVMAKQQEAFKTILTEEQKKIFEKNIEGMRRPPQD